MESAKELWDSLESKYMANYAFSKKFIKCGKTGHFKKDCRSGNQKNNASASGSGKGSKDQSHNQDHFWFKTYEPVEDRSVLYMGDDHFAHIHEKGRIIHETTAPYTPQQNGVAERKNKALKEMANAMLSYSGLSDVLWGEAMLTACYLLNRVPNKRNKTTTYELWWVRGQGHMGGVGEVGECFCMVGCRVLAGTKGE
nr:zinc finger, CCHC-type [Tanacetum cinerariifolium]